MYLVEVELDHTNVGVQKVILFLALQTAFVTIAIGQLLVYVVEVADVGNRNF